MALAVVAAAANPLLVVAAAFSPPSSSQRQRQPLPSGSLFHPKDEDRTRSSRRRRRSWTAGFATQQHEQQQHEQPWTDLAQPLTPVEQPAAAAAAAEPSRGTVPSPPSPEWIVYVDQSKTSLEQGGAATLDAFLGLSPARVRVRAAFFSKTAAASSQSKFKGPYVRCIPTTVSGNHYNNNNNNDKAFEVDQVNSVEKVHRILTRHMGLSGVTLQMCDCLKLKYKGTGYLEAEKIRPAIQAYNRALELHVPSQTGVILFMRAAAHAALAASQRTVLQDMVQELSETVPPSSTVRTLYTLAMMTTQTSATVGGESSSSSSSFPTSSTTASPSSSLTIPLLRRLVKDGKSQETQLGRIQYWHGLYQHALMKALDDALGATRALPGYAPAYERAGSILSDLWRLDESRDCYQRALELLRLQQRQQQTKNGNRISSSEDDEQLSEDDDAAMASLKKALELVDLRQSLVTNAMAYYPTASEEKLLLALDVNNKRF